jgi:hypothetical protein
LRLGLPFLAHLPEDDIRGDAGFFRVPLPGSWAEIGEFAS